MSSEQPNLENLLQMGITAARDGNKDGARALFQQVISNDKKNDRAWVWLAYVTEDRTKRQQYLKTALKINPDNTAAKKALEKISNTRADRDQKTLLYAGVGLLSILVFAALCCVLALALS